MTALTEFLFPAPARRTVGGIVRWWESRRLANNLFVGGAGLLSLGAMKLIMLLPPGFPGARIEWLPAQRGDVPRTWAEIGEARRLLGYAPAVTFEEGIARFVEWLMGQP